MSVIVLVFEDNLMWSARLKQSLVALGHTALVISRLPAEIPTADVAILNLGSTSLDAQTLVPLLKAKSIVTIGHAGHKEKERQLYGKESGCDFLTTNSEITFKLAELLLRIDRTNQAPASSDQMA